MRKSRFSDQQIALALQQVEHGASVAEVCRKRGLYFAGEYVAGAHTGAACASGRSIARLIKQHWI
jgi:hypothetical protein